MPLLRMYQPLFDFLTGCREFKRREESKRTLKNSFASRLAQFYTTQKRLRITDQWSWYIVRFRFRWNRDFLTLLSALPLAGGSREGKPPTYACVCWCSARQNTKPKTKLYNILNVWLLSQQGFIQYKERSMCLVKQVISYFLCQTRIKESAH